MELHIMKRTIEGDEQAFLSVMLAQKADLYRNALAFLKNEHDAIEAVQEVTFRAYKKIKTLKKPAYVKTWLIRIMINYCQDVRRKRRDSFHKKGLSKISQYMIRIY